MNESWDLIINQIRRLSEATGVKPDPSLYQIEGHFLNRLPGRLTLVGEFLRAVADEVEADSRPEADEVEADSRPEAEPKRSAKKATE